MNFSSKKIGFIIYDMTFLRYFVPLAQQFKNLGIQSTFLIRSKPSGKYNCPLNKENSGDLEKIAKENRIEIGSVRNIPNFKGIIFLIEGAGKEHLHNNPTFSLTYCADYRNGGYEKYVDQIDHIIFPSLHYAKSMNTVSKKNLYLGCPKYDVSLDLNNIIEKYKIPSDIDRNCLIIVPKLRDLHKANLGKLIFDLRSLGYNVIAKSRGKDSYRGILNLDHYFEDTSWHPHTTMELIKASSFVINFDSSTIEECIMLSKPILNFTVKTGGKGCRVNSPFVPMFYEYDFCKNLSPSYKIKELQREIEYLVTNNFDSEFLKCREEYIYTFKNSSESIVSWIKNNTNYLI